MTISAARGQGMTMVICKNFIDEKNKNFKSLTKTYIIYIKRKLKTCRNQIYIEKV